MQCVFVWVYQYFGFGCVVFHHETSSLFSLCLFLGILQMCWPIIVIIIDLNLKKENRANSLK